jgi:TRAP-type uncharacterized transport system fused permease subunit
MLLIADNATQIIFAAITGLAGTALLAVGVEGYLTIKLPIWLRPIFLAAALFLITPGITSDLIGLALAVAGWLIIQIIKRGRTAAAA